MKKNLSFPGQDSFVVKKSNKKKYAEFTTGIAYPSDSDDGTISPPPLPVLPVFPDFSVMDCAQLAVAYAQLNETLAAPSFTVKDKEWVSAYEKAIAYVQSLQMSKGCQTKHTPVGPADTTIKTTTSSPAGTSPVPGATGGIGGYGGGGGAAAPSATGSATKKPFPWLWVIIGAGVVLYFSSGKKG